MTETGSGGRVLVVGAGWAGLAAAVELVRNGRQVVVLEAAGQPGGRARRLTWSACPVDNGQHLLLGAYTHTLELLDTLGVDDDEVLLRLPLELEMRSPEGGTVHLKTPRWPAPLHLLWGLARLRGIAPGQRLRALLGLPRMMRWRGCADLSVRGLLQRHGQPPAMIRAFWEPLCLGALNTPIDRASAAIFIEVLREAFGRRRGHSDLLVPRRDLGALLPDPAESYLRQRDAEVRTGSRVDALIVESGRIRGVRTNGDTLSADTVVLATAPRAAARLLQAHGATGTLAEQIRAMGSAPICTVYLQYPPAIRLDKPMLGLLDGIGQWVFDRRHTGQPGLMAVVISGPGPHRGLPHPELAARIAAELARLFPAWPAPLRTRVVCEKQATFFCSVDIASLRPEHATPITGLWLAGDYTATGLPATLEGAVKSGLECARRILGTQTHPATT